MVKYSQLFYGLLLLTASSASSIDAVPFNRTVVVPATVDLEANGTALLAALKGFSPDPSPENRWLVKLEPGIYDVGSKPVSMRDYVDVEGSGIIATTIRGSVAPPDGNRLGGLVEGASHAELRHLTVTCESRRSAESCQGLSLDTASPRVTRVRFLILGTGSGSHWGIRAFDSRPLLQQVEILVTAENSWDSYGIVYGGSSKLDIERSEVVASGAANNNFAIVVRESPQVGSVKDSDLAAAGGRRAAGVMYLSYQGGTRISFDNTLVSAIDGRDESVGIGAESSFGRPDIWFRGGRILGETDGVDLSELEARLVLLNTEVFGARTAVAGGEVLIGSTWLSGEGSVRGRTLKCAAVCDQDMSFYANECPESGSAERLSLPAGSVSE